jgi:hypothetical protein
MISMEGSIASRMLPAIISLQWISMKLTLSSSTLAQGEDLDPGAAVAMGLPLLVRLYVPLWAFNTTPMPISAAVVPTRVEAAAPSPDDASRGVVVAIAGTNNMRVVEVSRPPPPGCGGGWL